MADFVLNFYVFVAIIHRPWVDGEFWIGSKMATPQPILFVLFYGFVATFLPLSHKLLKIVFVLVHDMGFGDAASNGDIPDDVRFKMADWRPFLFRILNVFAHIS